jgi:hypothetical protein
MPHIDQAGDAGENQMKRFRSAPRKAWRLAVRARSWWASLLVVLACATLVAGPARAGTGPVLFAPQPGVKIKSGLKMEVDFRGVEANGYRPVRVTISQLSGAAFTADRAIRVVVKPQAYAGSPTTQVTEIIEIGEGALSGTSVVAIPQNGQWWSASIEAFEDGDKVEDLSLPHIGWPAMNYWDWTEARPTILAIDQDVPKRVDRDTLVNDFKFRGVDKNPTHGIPDLRPLMALFPDPNRVQFVPGAPISDAAMLSQIGDQPRIEVLPLAEVAERWIELSQYDLIVVSLADLQTLAKNEPERIESLSAWAAGGPVLIVTEVGVDFAGLAAIETLLKLSGLEVDPEDPAMRGWQPADNQNHRPVLLAEVQDYEAYDDRTRSTQNPQYGFQPYNGFQNLPTYRGGGLPAPLASPAQTPFAVRPIAFGRIVALAGEVPQGPAAEDQWKWILNSVPRNHWTWYQRNGFSMHRTNDDYWSFLIPGVGEAPVISFLLLVSLFAIAIGPLNYILLGRAKRLYLLLITVPLGAFVVTGGLFAYALFTDGLSVRLRARSVTQIDQPAERAVSWSRQSYYAALAPSRGLTFPEDCTIFPIEHQPARIRSSEPRNKLAWRDAQVLEEGYLGARTTNQFMVLRSTSTVQRLDVREGNAAREPLQVTNNLQINLKYLLLRDGQGRYWTTDELGDGASAELSETTVADASKRLKVLLGENPPDFPEGYDPQVHSSMLSVLMPNNYSFYSVDGGTVSPVMASSLLEANLARAMHPDKFPLDRSSYVAIGGASPLVPYGVQRVREEASLHLILGNY